MSENLDYNLNISDLLEEMQGEKEEMTPPIIEEPEEPIFENETPEEPITNIINDIPNLADLLVGLIDMGFASIAQTISKNEEKEKYKLDSDEKQQAIKAWKAYLKNTPDFKMSPSSVLMLTMAIIYIPKSIAVMQDKKINLLQKENDILQSKIKDQNNGTNKERENS